MKRRQQNEKETKIMKTTSRKLENFESFAYSMPCYEVTDYTKKEPTDKDCYYLRYCLMRFIFKNQQHIYRFMDIENEKTIYNDVDEEASISCGSLHIGDFEGYQISDSEYIENIELTIENRVVLNICNSATDRCTTYLID